jgi:hypothetical protein
LPWQRVLVVVSACLVMGREIESRPGAS